MRWNKEEKPGKRQKEGNYKIYIRKWRKKNKKIGVIALVSAVSLSMTAPVYAGAPKVKGSAFTSVKTGVYDVSLRWKPVKKENYIQLFQMN